MRDPAMSSPETGEPPRTVVVVGAGPGLGAAVARRFGVEGTTVVLLARSAERLDDLVRTLRADGVAAHGVPADVADPSSLRAALATAAARWGDPDVCVYNASRYVAGAPTEVDVDTLVAGFLVGVAGALVTVQAVAPAMRRAGRGTVLLTGSGVAVRPFAGSSALGVQKAALRNLAASLADELEPDGVHVATVTISGVIGRGEAFAPDAIAERYWELYRQARGDWEREVVVR